MDHRNIRNNNTELNNEVLSGHRTEVNLSAYRPNYITETNTPHGTQINPGSSEAGISYGTPIELDEGTVLEGGYTILKRVCNASKSGEADLYLCILNDRNYVAKIFRRPDDRDEGLLRKLQELKHPNIAPIYAIGNIHDRPFHIFDYYPNGSLEESIERGERFSESQLKQWVIPQLNEALFALHEIGIFHRDIKPSNIMVTDDKRLVLIDFGISSVTREGHLTRVTKARFTSGYQAPEVALNVYYDISDYYSLGIVLYELFCGSIPSPDEGLVLSKPKGMQDELYNLIRGLTYADWKTRRQLNNPNRRWNYSETKKWLKGESQTVPGLEPEERYDRSIRKMPFSNSEYDDMDDLCFAMAKDWAAGKAFVFRGTLSRVLGMGQINGQCRDWIVIIDQCINNASNNQDFGYTQLLYTLSPNLENKVISELLPPSTIHEFGKTALSILISDNIQEKNILFTVLNRLLSLKQLSKVAAVSNPEIVEAISTIERKYEVLKHSDRHALHSLHSHLAYILSGDKTLHLEGCPEFTTVQQLKDHMKTLSTGNAIELYRFCAKLLMSEKKMYPMLYGWLAVHNCAPQGSEWLI